ncbi:MAG TPA: hypothetical protein VIW67_23575 [Terriglobales bacterium]|jgi:serine acetyltransferase
MDFAVIGLPNYYRDIFAKPEERIVRIGDDCRIYPWALVYEGATLEANVIMEERTTVGSRTSVGTRTRILYQAQINDHISVGQDCVVGGFVADNSRIGNKCSVFGSLVHSYANPDPTAWDITDEDGPVLEDHVFVGWGAVVVGNVRIGAGAWILPNSLVTENIPPGMKYGGRNTRASKPRKS